MLTCRKQKTVSVAGKPGRAHLVGACGSGMQSLAGVLLGRGWSLSGSDLTAADDRWLREAGVELFGTHEAEHVDERVDVLVHSDAIGPETPERMRARELGIKELSYPAALGQLMQGELGLAVAGTHGKSTTTAMAGQILEAAGLEPTVVFGACYLGAGQRPGTPHPRPLSRKGRGEFVAHPRPFSDSTELAEVHKGRGESAGRPQLCSGELAEVPLPLGEDGRRPGEGFSLEHTNSPHPSAPLPPSPGGRRKSSADRPVLVEACEFRSNFLHLAPWFAAVLNVEPDHFDCFPDLAAVEAAFARFVARIEPEGCLLANADCASTRRVMLAARCRAETFGSGASADWQATEVDVERGYRSFTLRHQGQELGRVALRVPGQHQVQNALAAAALAWWAGAEAEAICRGLGSFAGLERRLECRGTWGGVTLIDDYAHHPTELRAALSTVRACYPGRRLWCIFQPHQALRTRCLLDELARSLENADRIAVAEVFRAREGSEQPGEATAAELAGRIAVASEDVLNFHAPQAILEHIAQAVVPGDVVLVAGAGDIRKVTDGLAQRLGFLRAAA